MLKRFMPAFISAVAVAIPSFVLLYNAIALCNGEFIYPIDDTYIHIAMAKNLAEHGMWGVEPGKLAFCSSSPLWTILLAGIYWIFGVSEILPWWISLGFNIASVVLVDRLFVRHGVAPLMRIAASLAVALFGPFFCTTALGMEHAMHGFFILTTIDALDRWQSNPSSSILPSCACFFLATATRYESIFLLAPLCLGIAALVLWRGYQAKKIRFPYETVALLVFTCAPIFIYGIWAISQGGHFFPNSLLLKGRHGGIAELLRAVYQTLENPNLKLYFLHLLIIALVALAFLRSTSVFQRILALSLAAAIFGHFTFARVGQLCRYEAYLTSAGALVIIIGLADLKISPFRHFRSVLLASLGLVYLPRTLNAYHQTARSSADIYAQQVQMTRIFAAMPPKDRGCIALNDLGYMALHSQSEFVDLWGLGSQDAAELVMKHPGFWFAEDIKKLFADHNVKYVAVFDDWYPFNSMPEGTVDVGYLKHSDNIACGWDTVTFRATSADAAEKLKRHLASFLDKLLSPRSKLVIYP